MLINVVCMAGFAYVALMWVLTFRLRWLQRQTRSMGGAAAFDSCFGTFRVVSQRFLWSGNHRNLADQMVSALVLTCRTLFVLVGGFFAYVILMFLATILSPH